MEEIRLVRPAPSDKARVLKYRDAFNGSIPGGSGLESMPDYETWLKWICDCEKEETCPPNRVPSYTYLVERVSDGKIVGIQNLRLKLNDHLLQFGGHIGYSTHPDERQKGYASAALHLVLIEAAKHGIARALITCNKENAASRNTILSAGGVLENELEEAPGEWTQRYWAPCPVTRD